MNPSEQNSQSDPNSTAAGSGANPGNAAHSRRVFLFKLSLLLNGAVGAVLAAPIVGYLLGPALKRSSQVDSWIDLGPLTDFPEGETRLVEFPQPGDHGLGWANGRHSLLGSAHWWGPLSSVCHQLCSSRMPRALVRAVEAVSMSLPRRRLLRGRIARIGTTGTRSL